MRFAAVLFRYWPLIAAGVDVRRPYAVMQSRVVLDCSPPASAVGVRRGQRQREAMRHCPEMQLVEADSFRDSRQFEPIVQALLSATPRLELTAPGLCTLPAAGAAKYYGSEAALIDALVHAVEQLPMPPGGTHPVETIAIGIADSRFAARQAALTWSPATESPVRFGKIIPTGRTASFLAPLPVSALEMDELETLSRRLGIYTLGDFAALPSGSVMSRFGSAGAHAQLLAKGLDPQPLAIHTPAEELTASAELDPPAERVDMATFAAKPVAAELLELLTRRGLACTQIRIEAETEHAESNSRLWRASPVFDEEMIVARVRWQLNGWLSAGSTAHQPTAGINLIRITADEVGDASDLQMGLWGELSHVDRRAIRGLDRVQGLLGTSAVFLSQLDGGRTPSDRIIYTPWGQPQPPSVPPMPWPGQLPTPSPSLVHRSPIPIEVSGTAGPITVSLRGEVNAEPARLRTPRGSWRTVNAWTGPWLSEEQWWEPDRGKRQARFQLVTSSPENPEALAAHLCVVRRNEWWIEATYD